MIDKTGASTAYLRNSLAREPLKDGWDITQDLINLRAGKGKVIKAMASDGVENVASVGMLSSQVIQSSKPASVSVQLKSVKKDVIVMMNKLPREVNVAIADEINARIATQNWPIDHQEIQETVREMVSGRLAVMKSKVE